MEHIPERRRTDRRRIERRGLEPKELEDARRLLEVERRHTERRKFERRELERKKMEKALHENEERRRIILKDIEEAYYEADLNSRFTFVNNALCNSLGYTREELIGQKYWHLVDETTIKMLQEAVDKSYKTNEPINLLDMEAIRKDGTKLIYETAISVIRDIEETVIGFRGISRDVTKRRQMEDALKRNQEELIRKNKEIDDSRENIKLTLKKLENAYEELKTSQSKILRQEKMASIGQLAAGVAHEINNPVAFIMSNLRTLDKYLERLTDFIQTQSEVIKSFKDQDSAKKLKKKRKELKLDYVIEDIKGLITESIDGSERVQRIVNELSCFSRMDEEECKDADINQCIESAINIVWHELKYKSTLKKDYGNLSLVRCYPRQMDQVFVNLLINAVQAIEEQGEIEIKTWEEAGSIWVAISDTGCGIAQDDLHKVFEPFFTTKDVGKGTGLGLSIIYEIVQKHRGEITFESKVGKGTTFTVKIPAVR